jgi:hypothetical protein
LQHCFKHFYGTTVFRMLLNFVHMLHADNIWMHVLLNLVWVVESDFLAMYKLYALVTHHPDNGCSLKLTLW